MVLKENRSGLELKFFNLTNEVLKTLNLELYDLEWVDRTSDLRIFVMNPETKTAVIDDCVNVDRALSPYIEAETWMPENLNLEVSSPGLYRNMNTISHFQMSLNEEIQLTLNKKIDEDQAPVFPKALRNNLKLKVKLIEVREDSILVLAKDTEVEIPFKQIKKANLETDINYKEK